MAVKEIPDEHLPYMWVSLYGHGSRLKCRCGQQPIEQSYEKHVQEILRL